MKITNPDEVVELKTPAICDCGQCLETVNSQRKTRQVFDIPKPRILVTEYVAYTKTCPGCGKIHRTEFPVGIIQPTQYGENMQTLMNYSTTYQLIPLQRTAEAIRDLTGQAISEGTLVQAAKVLSEKIADTVETIKQTIIQAPVVHFDETGIRTEGQTKWMHVASTENLTYYETHEKRGEKAAHDIGILPYFQGVAVHDHWKPYYCFNDCTHGECNAHNLRYLKDVTENYYQEWAGDMASLLIEINRRVKALKAEGFFKMSKEEIQIWQDQYHHIYHRERDRRGCKQKSSNTE